MNFPRFSCQAYQTGRLGTIFRGRWGYELASLLWRSSRMQPRPCTAYCLLILIRQDCALKSLARQDQQFCYTNGKSHRLCSIFKYHCKQGCWMHCIAYHMLWLGFLVGWPESYIEQWQGYKLVFLPRCSRRTSSKAGKTHIYITMSLSSYSYQASYQVGLGSLLISGWSNDCSPTRTGEHQDVGLGNSS